MTPDQFTIEEKMLNVGGEHRLYTQLWGNNNSTNVVVFLHGGPGSGCSDKHKSLFNPKLHKVIFIDQRGCGKSLPYGSLVDNDTDHLIEDINKVTAYFKADTFSITGGSWGSCLALAYSIKYPKKVNKMVLRGIFTGRKSEIDFMDKGEFRAFFPDVWEEFMNSAPKEYRDKPSAYHLKRVLGKDAHAAKVSAYAYSRLEGSVVSLDDRVDNDGFDDFDPAPTIIECHYLAHGCFLPDNYIVDNSAVLTMPVLLVQGRYDSVCPPFTAYELNQKLPNSKLYWTISGHSGNDRSNWDLTKALLES